MPLLPNWSVMTVHLGSVKEMTPSLERNGMREPDGNWTVPLLLESLHGASRERGVGIRAGTASLSLKEKGI